MLARLPMPIPVFSIRAEQDNGEDLEEKDASQFGASGPAGTRQSPDFLESGASELDPGLSVIPLETGEEKTQLNHKKLVSWKLGIRDLTFR